MSLRSTSLTSPGTASKLGFGKAVLQPHDLAMEIGRLLQLLDRGLALLVELLQKPPCSSGFRTICCRRHCRSSVGKGNSRCEVDNASGELVEQVDLLDQSVDRLGDGIERLRAACWASLFSGSFFA